MLKVPMARYVDDFLGGSRKHLVRIGGRCLAVMLGLCGLAPGKKKSEDDAQAMVGLGHGVAADLQKKEVLTPSHQG